MASDIDAIFSYRSLEEVALYQYWYPYTKEQTAAFINQNKDSDLNILDKWNGFAIISKTDNTLIGDCAIRITNETAEIGCNISPIYQGKGFAKEALQLLIDASCNKHNIHAIYAIIDSNNFASKRLLESLGMIRLVDFEEESICKNLICIEHKYFLKKERS